MPRTCGVCKQNMREGDEFLPVRLGAESGDPSFLASVRAKEALKPGLYHACPECVAHVKPHAASRVTAHRQKVEHKLSVMEERPEAQVNPVKPEELTDNDLV